jgi:hypothetical protein
MTITNNAVAVRNPVSPVTKIAGQNKEVLAARAIRKEAQKISPKIIALEFVSKWPVRRYDTETPEGEF